MPSTSSIAADAEIWRFPISTEAASGPSLRTSTPFLAYNRHVPCPTQRTHAIGLWVARNTAWCAPFSAKYLRNSAFLTRGISATPPLRPLHSGGPHSSFGMYLQMMQQASLLRPACCTSWAWARAGCSSPRATPVHFESQEARVSFRDSSGRRWPLHTPVAPSARMGCRIRLTHAPQPAYEYAPSHSAVSRRVPPTRRALDGACPPFSAKDPL